MIWINVSYTLQNKTGIGRYILTFLRCLSKYNTKTIELKTPKWLRFTFIWQMIWLNTIIYIKTLLFKPEIIVSPTFIMPFFTRKKTKYITVIHDLCHLRKSEETKYQAFIYDLATKIAIKKADIIVTVSEMIKNELVEKFSVNPDRIKVVHNAIADYFINFKDEPKFLEKYGIQDKKYILSVATLNKRKNIPELIKAFESISDKYPDIKLLLVGGMGNEQREKLTKHPNIIFTGYIKDEEIPVLYNHAMMYIFPSHYEGFGTPIIEAQYSKIPLICSDISAFREVAGIGAEFCTTEAKGIAEKIEFLINNPQRQEELVKAGSENVKRFSIEKITNQIISMLNNNQNE